MNGGTDAAGAVVIGSRRLLTYGVNNVGDADLTLGANAVTVSGAVNCAVDILSQPGQTVGPGLMTTFDLRLTPAGAGAFSAEVSLANNDADESPYEFSIEGSGSVPAPSLLVTAETTFRTPDSDTPISEVWELSNVGQSKLTITAITSNKSEFSVAGATLPAEAEVGEKVSVTVTFTPGAEAFITADIEITSDSGGTAGTVASERVTGIVDNPSDGDGGGCHASPVAPFALVCFAIALLLAARRLSASRLIG